LPALGTAGFPGSTIYPKSSHKVLQDLVGSRASSKKVGGSYAASIYDLLGRLEAWFPLSGQSVSLVLPGVPPELLEGRMEPTTGVEALVEFMPKKWYY
jgi:hypothetical protein